MFRKQLLPIAAALLLTPLFVTAQDSPPTARTVEMRLAGLSRGYMQPMQSTAARIKGLEGILGVEMLGFSGDMARFSVSTTLDDAGLAGALQLKLLGTAPGVVTLAAENGMRATHAEARWRLLEIAQKISEQPKPSWRGGGEALFKDDASLKAKMERLGLSFEGLDGALYKQKDYHIDETWEGSSGEYRIWAGDKWEGIYVPSNDWYYDDSEHSDKPTKPDPNSRFVGLRVYRSSWQNSMTWVDHQGLLLTGISGRRDELDSSGELCVKRGAGWMNSVLSAVAGYRVRHPKAKVDELPQGRGWNIVSSLRDDEGDNSDIERWDIPNYDLQAMRLQWRENDGKLTAVLTAHHDFHPFYLEAEVDTNAVLDAHADLGKKARESVRRPELGDALKWIVGAEQEIAVFERRREEARNNSAKILAALREAAKAHDLDALCGRLDDAELVKRLGLEMKPVEFTAADYTIHRQMLGDVEICVGSPRTGGRMWVLANVAEGKTIRSSQ